MESTKVCRGCEREFPRTKQYFYGRASAPDGLHDTCKECEGHHFKQADPPGYRTCSKCGKRLPETEEYFRRRGTKDRGGLRPDCRECSNERDSVYYAANPEKFHDYRQANRQRIAAYMKEYWPRYFDTTDGHEAHRAAFRRYLQTDNGKLKGRLGAQRRRARKASVLIAFTPGDWQTCLAAFDGRCAYCGQADPSLHQDHVLALSNGGTYTPDNIVPACIRCNSSKFNHDFVEWYADQPFFDTERRKRILKHLAQRKGSITYENGNSLQKPRT